MHGASRIAKFFVPPQVLPASERQRYCAVKRRALRFRLFLMPEGDIGGAPMPPPLRRMRATAVNVAGFCCRKG
jgi:hypothetical protein